MLTTKTIAAAFTAIGFTLAGTAAAMAFPSTMIDTAKAYELPTKNSNYVGKFYEGQTVNVKTCVKDDSWCLVSRKGKTGWVRSKMLDFDEEYDDDFGFVGNPGVKVCLGGWQGSICISD